MGPLNKSNNVRQYYSLTGKSLINKSLKERDRQSMVFPEHVGKLREDKINIEAIVDTSSIPTSLMHP